MEYANHLNEYDAAPTVEQVAEEVKNLKALAAANNTAEVYKVKLKRVRF